MKITNTLTKRKEEFYVHSNVVNMYVCGVTTYDDCHIGHAMSYIIFDVIRRYLEFKGYEVKYVQNFTDIDDKIINRAQELGIEPLELSSKYISRYFEDADSLNIKRAHFYPKATEEIPEIIDIVKTLIEKGCAYESGGSVYFRVRNFTDYGKLSGQNIEEMMSKSNHEESGKEHPLDFALWKATKPGEPFWTSPWGEGRPGWHIECSAMSLKYLGKSLDIHGGGQDLIFPHHENELAQSESFTGVVPFTRYWLHNGLLQMGKEKMSKSLGNLVTVKEILQRHSPDAIRYFIISSHYRNPLTYSEEALEAAERGVERLKQAISIREERSQAIELDSESFRQRFIVAMDDDFSTAQATAVLFELVREINRAKEEGLNVAEAQKVLKELVSILGFTLKEIEKPVLKTDDIRKIVAVVSAASTGLSAALSYQYIKAKQQPEIEDSVEALISWRNELRRAKHWHLADKIRDQLADSGVALEDTPKGTIWKYLR